MIKVKVISIFKDINTNEVYKLNKELVVTKERYSEIKDYVKIIENKNEKKCQQEAEN